MAKFILSAFADEASPALDAQIEALRDNGISLLEPRGVDGKGVLALTEQEAKAAREKLDAAGIGVSAIGSPIGKIGIKDDFAPHFESFRHAVELAHIFGTERIRMFSFYMPKGEDPEPYFGEVVDRVGKLVEYAEANGVHCCHENEKGIYGDMLARVQKLHEALPTLRCVFDPANYIQCGDVPKTNFEALRERIDYLHIKDALPESGTVVPAGEGAGDVPYILKTLSETDRTYILTLEPHLSEFVGLDQLQGEKVRRKYAFASPREAFDAAANALHTILHAL